MNEQSFQALEYDKLRRLLRRYASTPMGARRFDELVPFADRAGLSRELTAVAESARLRERGVSLNFADIADPTDSLAVLRIENATLEPIAMLELANLAQQALSARAIVGAERADAPVLWEIAETISRELQRTARRIQERILPGGILDDRASPELARLRSDIQRQRERITKSLETVMRRTEVAVQDEYVTLRNDRFVIPVKADFRGRITGVAHGFSSSGQTIFIEPLQTIEANNELQALREAEERETARVLFELTEQLRWDLSGLETAANAVEELDFIGAKTSFLRAFNAVVPEISADAALRLEDARHPLLEENLRGSDREIIPLSFGLTDGRPVMIISGANAGGKTVVLKTAGLLSLMGRSGLPVPARRAEIPFYNAILADIGDQQSIAANLSTFTSHISNISRMMTVCETPALVLLDEVGTGTDPEEGSALGVAIVDHFRQNCGAHVLASTHYRGLKMYAANQDFVQNASVEFDERTLQPTYHLRVGVAGASAGIDIAGRFGIPQMVIEAARSNVDRSALDAADYLRNLRREVVDAEEMRRALEDERQTVAGRFDELERDFERREIERRKQFEAELLKSVDEFDRQARGLLENLEDKAARVRLEKDIAARKAELKRQATVSGSKFQAPDQKKTADQPETRNSKPETPITVGAKVRLLNFGTVGTIEKLSGDEAEVLVGVMRLREHLSNLEPFAEAAEQPEKQSRAERLQGKGKGTAANLSFDEENFRAELNLVGKRVDEATDAVDKFLDEAFLSGFPRVRVIHGIGTGALKNAVHAFLRGHPHVARYTLATQDQGGNGATVVELKQ